MEMIQGEGDCVPAIKCAEVDIQKDCSKEFLLIFDEADNHKVICAKAGMKDYVTATQGTTLKLRFMSMSKPKETKKGFKCLVQCFPASCNNGKLNYLIRICTCALRNCDLFQSLFVVSPQIQ